eukprot:305740-Rhodomonas_salina.3
MRSTVPRAVGCYTRAVGCYAYRRVSSYQVTCQAVHDESEGRDLGVMNTSNLAVVKVSILPLYTFTSCRYTGEHLAVTNISTSPLQNPAHRHTCCRGPPEPAEEDEVGVSRHGQRCLDLRPKMSALLP